MSTGFTVRCATLADLPCLARHRAEMFRDMGVLPDALYDAMVDATRRYLDEAMRLGEYVAWLAAPEGDDGTVIAGAGLQLRRALPGIRRASGEPSVATGPQGLIVNVFTERPWRRRGVAAMVMRQVLDGARAAGVSNVVLHASPEGRPLYESLGFAPTNEMRYKGEL